MQLAKIAHFVLFLEYGLEHFCGTHNARMNDRVIHIHIYNDYMLTLLHEIQVIIRIALSEPSLNKRLIKLFILHDATRLGTFTIAKKHTPLCLSIKFELM